MRAVITGGQGDIARELAKQLEAAGWNVDAYSREELDVTEDVVIHDGREPVDALVNCAGVALWKTGAAAAGIQFDVNALGAMRVTDALIPYMVSGGRVVMVTSEIASAPTIPLAAAGYAMSKAALGVLARAYATTYPHLVVRTVCPGSVRTKMNESGQLSPEDGARKIVEACLP